MKMITRYSHCNSKEAVLAERCNTTNTNLLEKSVFEKKVASWINETTSETKKYNMTKQCSTNITTTQTSFKIIEDNGYNKLLDKGKEKTEFK